MSNLFHDPDLDDEEDFNSTDFVQTVKSLIRVIVERDDLSMEKFVILLGHDLASIGYNKFASVSLKAMSNEFKEILETKFKDQNELDQAEYFKSEKLSLLRRAEKLLSDCNEAPQSIAGYSQPFMLDKRTILVRGSSSAILEVLKSAAKRAVQERTPFTVYCTESRVGNTGGRAMAMEMFRNPLFHNTGIKVRFVTDYCMHDVMDEIDMVLVGADLILKSGGIINRIGTYGIALAARKMNKPVFVAAESYKLNFDEPARNSIFLGVFDQDYTPAHYLTKFWTDIGTFHPYEVGHNLDRTFLKE